MTKDEFHKSAREQNNQAASGKKDAAGTGTASVQARPPQPRIPGPLVPKAPFGMPAMPVATNIKVIRPSVLPGKDSDLKEPDTKLPE